MSPTLDACLRSWPLDPWLLAGLLATGAIYLRGWLRLRRRDSARWHAGHLAAFAGGLAALFLALDSPIEPLAGLLLSVHMIQHLLLMMVAPPLVWLGEPLLPLLAGLPEPVRTYWARPLLRSRRLRRIFGALAHPLVALPVYVGVTWAWHIPAVYDLALRSSGWHYAEHACFLGAALLFWHPVVRPRPERAYPARPRWSRWLLVPYLLLADVQNTLLSAVFAFAPRPLYTYYTQVPRLGGLSPLDDQRTAGVLMWVPGSLVFLVPLVWIAVRLLSAAPQSKPARSRASHALRPQPGMLVQLEVISQPRPIQRATAGRLPGPRFDLLRLPLVGRFLKWPHARRALQLPLAALAALLIYDGLTGPQTGALNLAGVLPWIHWRGLLVLGLLVGGNFFCLACPFTLPRALAGRWIGPRRAWPRVLRSKWLAAALVALFLWSYEALALWDRPWWTAWIALGYFGAAFVTDGLFRGASFCKYVCPIGQFNFVQSLVSPLAVQVREPAACAACRTHDCLQGRAALPGCQLELFLPRKVGNMDCTLCLDCVHACPHDNVGLIAGLPGRELWIDPVRSGIGRFSRRPDLAALVLVLVFGAFANAAAMVAPVVTAEQYVCTAFGCRPLWITSGLFFAAVVLLPIIAVFTAAAVARRWGRLSESLPHLATRFSYALVPIGFAMWLAHYGFHLLTSYGSLLPVSQRFAGDLGWSWAGLPAWQAACCRPVGAWLPQLEIVLLDAGWLLSLYAVYRIAASQAPRPGRVLGAFAPWAAVATLLFAAGVGIVLQPMQMRGALEVGAREPSTIEPSALEAGTVARARETSDATR